MGPTSKGRERKEGECRAEEGRGRWEGRGGKRTGRGGKEDLRAFPQLQICHYTTVVGHSMYSSISYNFRVIWR